MFLVEPSRTPEMGQDVLSLWCECFYKGDGPTVWEKRKILSGYTHGIKRARIEVWEWSEEERRERGKMER